VDVENVVDSEFDGVDVGDDFLELVRGSAAFGEVVHFGRRRRRSASAGVVLEVVLMMLVSSLGRVGVVTVARVVVTATV
jgi:hypothetical protein